MRRDDYNYANVLDTLRVKQEEVSNDLETLNAAEAGAEQVQPFAVLKTRLRQLMSMEEETLYPAVAAQGEDQDAVVDTALVAHDTIEAALVDLETSITAPKLTTLTNAVNTHFAAERGELFSFAREINSNVRHELGMEAGDIQLGIVS